MGGTRGGAGRFCYGGFHHVIDKALLWLEKAARPSSCVSACKPLPLRPITAVVVMLQLVSAFFLDSKCSVSFCKQDFILNQIKNS